MISVVILLVHDLSFRNLNEDFRKAVHEFLGVRGIDDELSVFLHDYMMNKDRIELIQWLRNVKSYVKKIG